MAHGGKRNGAGRPPGALNTKTVARKEAVKRALESETTPLDVLTEGMRHHYHKWRDAEEGKKDVADLQAAAELAAKAAPYVHPRLQSIEANVDGSMRYEPKEVPVAEREPIPGVDASARPTERRH